MPTIYDGKKIIPSPLCVIRKEYNRTDDETILSPFFTITLSGTLVPYKGSPNSLGVFHNLSGYPADETILADSRLTAILRKQEALRSLFINEGRTFEIQGFDGAAPLKCNPRIKSIEFAEGLWFEKCDYTIELEADIVYVAGTAIGEDSGLSYYYVKQASEEWNIEAGDTPNSYRMTHNVSAKGTRFYDDTGTLVREAWENARLYVIARIGIDPLRVASPGVINLTGYNGYNHARVENINELTGDYSVSETWILNNAAAIEDYNVVTRTSLEDGRTFVTIDGTVNGLDTRDTNFAITTDRYTAANTYFNASVSPNLVTRAQSYSGITLNAVALNSQVGRNPISGTITYSYEYNNRATATIPGALQENITIVDIHPGDVFAQIPVPGRADGPILQDIVTKTARERQINIEVRVPAATLAGISAKPVVTPYITANTPTGVVVFRAPDRETWRPLEGIYGYDVSWTYEV